MLRALIWDVDGTIAETERDGHRVAFNHAFEAQDLPWRWDVPTYGLLLGVAGGFERLLYDIEGRVDAPSSDSERVALARCLHAIKNAAYGRIVDAGHIALRPGVLRLMRACAEADIVQAIATTTSRANVAALFAASFGSDWAQRFRAVVCAEDAPSKKPDPLVYRVALTRLTLEAPDVLAVEDSPNGLLAARAAGIATLVTRSDYFRHGGFDGAAACCDDLDSRVTWAGGEAACVDIAVLRRVHAEAPARGFERPGMRSP